MDDADLEKLTVSPGKLTPSFHKNTTEYAVVIASNAKEVKVSPLTSSTEASYEIKGGDGGKVVPLQEGEVKEIKVEVAAEDGKSTKVYLIKTKRLSSSDASLENLTLSSGKLIPEFSPTVRDYSVCVSAHVDSIKLIPSVADRKAKFILDGSGDINDAQNLNFGQTKLKILVTAPDGKNESCYDITITRRHLGCSAKMADKELETKFQCSICLGVLYQPVGIKGSKHNALFCQPCISIATRTSKVDPVDESSLEDDWMVERPDVEEALSDAEVLTMSKEKVKLRHVARIDKEWRDKNGQPKIENATADGCSSDGPELKHSVSVQPWESKLRQEGDDFSPEKCNRWLEMYHSALSGFHSSVQYKEGESPVDILYCAAACQANGIKRKSKDAESHFKLAQILEEIYIVQDFYGIRKSERDESEEIGPSAVESSKEEEFLAICNLRGVSESAPLARQLKAVEEEYKHLKELNQSAKSEHVQSLYQWKSKQAIRGSKLGMASSSDMESDLGKAFHKYMDALSLDSSKHQYNLHVGRMLLMQGRAEDALERLKIAMAIKPNIPETRLYYGLALCQLDRSKEGARWLNDALQYILQVQCQLSCLPNGPPWPPSAMINDDAMRVADPLIGRAFVTLAEAQKKLGNAEQYMTVSEACCNACLIAVRQMEKIASRASVFRQFEWILLDAHFLMLDDNKKNVSSIQLATRCERLSVLSRCSSIPPEKQLLELQMHVCEMAVSTLPSSSLALCHLGDVQLAKFDQDDTKEGQNQLDAAALSYRASISVEGKPKHSKDVPPQLEEQKWWKEKTLKVQQQEAKKQAPTGSATKAKPGAPSGPASGRGQTGRGAPGPGRGRGSSAPARPGVGVSTAKSSSTAAKVTARPGATKPTGGVAAVKSGSTTAARGAGGGRSVAGGQSKTAVSAGKKLPVTKAPGKGTGVGSSSSKGVATLGELKSGLSSPSAGKVPEGKKEEEKKKAETPEKVECAKKEEGEVNSVLHQSRLGLARALSRDPAAKGKAESETLYREVIKMAPGIHDAYIELADMLVKDDPLVAVDVYTQFPFPETPTFDDAYIHGEIIRLLMKAEQFEHPRLGPSLISFGRIMGIGSLEKYVNVLDAKFKTNLLKSVYAGVHGKDVNDPDLQAFFKFKCWV
eukprot:m.52505 g.52505  ORF g.52505 m.52505 type:complete len:1143 (+) comp34215_c0_seq2:19-3447(+)